MFVNTPLISSKEKTLGMVTLVLGLLVWLLLVISTLGMVFIFLGIMFIFYLFAQSAFISYIKGNGVELTAEQFPDLHAHFLACCERLEITEPPKAYMLSADGMLNAFATRFLGTNYVVLLSDIVDAMEAHPDGVRFYIGHELGHIRMKHLTRNIFRLPVLWLPLLGAAYSRAQETTCDLHGLACSGTHEGAAKAMAVLAAGPQRWKDLNLTAYVKQTSHSSGFWMSLHEVLSGYPWLTKRIARIVSPDNVLPKRNPLAYFFALFIPYSGRLGPLFSLLIMFYVIMILAFSSVRESEYSFLKVLMGMPSQEAMYELPEEDSDTASTDYSEENTEEESSVDAEITEERSESN